MDDRQIIELYWQRDPQAIEATSRQYSAYCHTIAQNILSNQQDAEECVNDTWLSAWNAIPPQRPDYLRAFLGKITRNLALDRYSYNTAQKRNGRFDLILEELSECIADPGDAFEDAQIARVISDFLRQLPDDHRNLFLRRYYYADSMEAVSLRFGISISKAKSILFRIRKKLKTQLEKEGIAL